MNPVRILLIVLGVLSAMLFIALPITFSRRLSSGRAARRVKYHAAKTAEALRDLTAEQRDEALGRARATMDQLDEKIDDLQQKMYEGWDLMDKSAREKTVKTIDNLNKERNQVAEWYGAMMHSSSQAWGDVKDGFIKSFENLRASFQQAQSEFSS